MYTNNEFNFERFLSCELDIVNCICFIISINLSNHIQHEISVKQRTAIDGLNVFAVTCLIIFRIRGYNFESFSLKGDVSTEQLRATAFKV